MKKALVDFDMTGMYVKTSTYSTFVGSFPDLSQTTSIYDYAQNLLHNNTFDIFNSYRELEI